MDYLLNGFLNDIYDYRFHVRMYTYVIVLEDRIDNFDDTNEDTIDDFLKKLKYSGEFVRIDSSFSWKGRYLFDYQIIETTHIFLEAGD